MLDTPPPFDTQWFRALIGFVIGIMLGSFITMLSYRLPIKLSIIKPDSFCPNCKKSLQVSDLVPIGSWLCSGGKCRHCQVRISPRYPLIELLTGISCGLILAVLGFSLLTIFAFLLIIILITYLTILIER